MLYLLLILTTTLYNGAVCLFIYWLCWVFIAAPRLSPVEVSTGLLSSCGGQASRCSGFSCEAWALGTQALVIATCGLGSAAQRL